jgi:hypothetical protein
MFTSVYFKKTGEELIIMNKKIVGTFGIVLIMLSIAITIPVIGETNEKENLGTTSILAIGTFTQSEDEEVIYAHIFIGKIGLKPVINLDIEICYSSIKNIVMTNHFLRCVVVK